MFVHNNCSFCYKHDDPIFWQATLLLIFLLTKSMGLKSGWWGDRQRGRFLCFIMVLFIYNVFCGQAVFSSSPPPLPNEVVYFWSQRYWNSLHTVTNSLQYISIDFLVDFHIMVICLSIMMIYGGSNFSNISTFNHLQKIFRFHWAVIVMAFLSTLENLKNIFKKKNPFLTTTKSLICANFSLDSFFSLPTRLNGVSMLHISFVYLYYFLFYAFFFHGANMRNVWPLNEDLPAGCILCPLKPYFL